MTTLPKSAGSIDLTVPGNELFELLDSDGDSVSAAVQESKSGRVVFALQHICTGDEQIELNQTEQYVITAYDGEDYTTGVCQVRYICKNES